MWLSVLSVAGCGSPVSADRTVHPRWTEIPEPEPREDYWSYVVGGGGDVNADGFDDVIVATKQVNDPHEGRAEIYLGSTGGIGTVAAVTLLGSGQLGASIAGAGDVDGDGFGDVVLGAPAESRYGAAIIWYGSALDENRESILIGSRQWTSFGESVALADLDGDGLDDIVVGGSGYRAPGSSGNQPGPGGAWIYLGRPGGISSGADQIVEDGHYGQGMWVSSLGDVDADGYADVGTAYPMLIVRGSSALEAPVLEMRLPEQWSSANVCAGGDIDGDGFDDILAGSPEFDGVYAYYGAPDGYDPEPSRFVAGRAPGHDWVLVAGVGDQDGDGFDDALMSSTLPGKEGITYLVPGSAAGLGEAASATFSSTPYEPYNTTRSLPLATAGDVNGDSFADFLLSGWGEGGTIKATVYYGSDQSW
jgi:hypothetical protein